MAFHLYDINELYTNADGSVQFVELITTANGESFWQGQALTVTQGGVTRSFTFPSNLPSSTTANKTVLVATQGFADLGIITPDFIVPNGFLFTSGTATVNFAGVDSVTYTSIPTDGTLSINRNGVTAVNSPKNFAGATGTVPAGNAAPVSHDLLADAYAGAGQAFVLDVPAGDFTDANDDPLAYGATLADGSPLPAWLSFDPDTRSFGGTPGAGDAGTNEVKVSVSDGNGGEASDTFALTVISGHVLEGGAGNDSLAGTVADDRISGFAGDDTLQGGLGADTMLGGAGNDTYEVDNASDVVTEASGEGTDSIVAGVTLSSLAPNVENLSLAGSGDLDANGNALANAISGNAGNNALDGGAGADTMAGGAGNDTYTVDAAGDTVVEGADEGDDSVLSPLSWSLGANVERLFLTGSASVNATGNALANALTGNAGHNVLDGGSGADTMTGGAGNDTYVVDDAGDAAVENADEGTDLVRASVTWTLGDNLENLTLTGSGAIGGAGNALANRIAGNAGDNTLEGGAGADTLTGGAGADAFRFAQAPDGDTVRDFQPGVDRIELDSAIYGDLNLVSYTADTGELFYDGNGAAPGGLELIAVLLGCGTAHPVLDLSASPDIVIL